MGRALAVGLTGGIGAGKSEVARRLATRGALVVDADQLARQVVAPGTPGLAAVRAEFGDAVLRPDGSLDRPALARLVFADQAALQRLNAIVHPLVRAETDRRIAVAPAGSIVVNDVPLLVEAGLAERYDVVVVVAADKATAIRRLVANRGMAEADARARIAAQAPLADKLKAATYVVPNDGGREDLERAVGELWERLLARAIPLR